MDLFPFMQLLTSPFIVAIESCADDRNVTTLEQSYLVYPFQPFDNTPLFLTTDGFYFLLSILSRRRETRNSKEQPSKIYLPDSLH